MEAIILITGKVNHTVTLDPTLWIFDERRFEMKEYFPDIDGLGMEFAPFLAHAEPQVDADHVVLHQQDGTQIPLSLKAAQQAILQFAEQGKPIGSDGPALFYLNDGSHRNQPIGSIRKVEVK
ncbi:hypothetical protein [Marininema halotolerans]|uniref:Peptidyl-prolyl cis-trans isomerase n=1 Tax=Marininema halotolerans TaxID=1155944 RepID=A0A1I6RNF7_9BACL|nr:hypothetical protein [Marininema halotolerans]SFS65988.1 hypothetical protein SAMN05444972_105217 [Marininema halotolerans]